jgi:hypothetical protein
MESKQRLVEVTDIAERDALMHAAGDLACPWFTIAPGNRIYADPDQLRAWRAAGSPHTSGAAK